MAGKIPLRVAVWSTGGIGSIAIRAVQRRPDLQLVGVWVHSAEKVGRDAGILAGGAEVGITATHDAQALIDLQPDCIVYGASSPARDAIAVPDYIRFLEAGINVVSTTSTRLIYPSVYEAAARGQLETAAQKGRASLYVSGIFPGFASDQLALVLATQSMSIRSIRVSEVSLNDHYPVASVMMDGMGFGRPLDFTPHLGKPGAIETVWKAPLHLMAAGLGLELQEVRGVLDRELTQRPLPVAFGTLAAGTCGAVRTRAIGMAGGRESIVIEHIIRMARDVAPRWPQSHSDATYQVTIEGDPDIQCSMTLGPPEGHAAGQAAMTATAMRVVNAIPYVVAAQPGLHSVLDLPMTVPRQAFV
jgi:hypothetical protein